MTEVVETRAILLVDDNADDRARVHRMLRGHRRQYEIVDCVSGAEALAILKKGETHFDCALLDQYLSDMEGVEVLNRLRGSRGQVPLPVTMLTGHGNDAAAAYALELGAEDYLLKDEVTPHALVRSIENVIEKFEIRRELESQRAAIELRNDRLESMRAEAESRLADLAAATQARDRFVAMMSHEMRTPLNAILGYAELLELEIEGQINDGQRRNLDRIRVGSRHLLDLINDVLDLARADARKLELDVRPVDVNAVIEEVAALLENQAEQKSLRLRTRVATSLPLVSADLQRLRQILTNLVGNAIKFTERGEVAIAATGDDGRSVSIAVTDTGIGIDPATLGNVFNEFFQADNALTRIYGGSGLGLAISQRLARAMGGEITVESTVDKGSTFTVRLPAAAAGSAVRDQDSALHDARMAHHHAADEAPAPLREPVSVIAFGDEPDALAALARQVKPAVRLTWTTTADDVSALAARERASLVILDIGSRQGSAWRVAHALSEMKVEVPPAILLLPEIIAQRETPAIGGAGLDLGWVALVPKPFTSDQLARAVSTAAGQRDSAESRGGPDAIEVLVIDDDEDSRRVASRVLRDKGIRVRESIDGENGLVEMRVRPPDVVVLDLMMPVLDGFGVLATMRADPLLSSIPVVVLTAKTLTDAERQFLTRSAVRVLQKGEHRLADVAALVLRAALSARGTAPSLLPD
ncbi:MAG TPA: response regulator [Gemmatimonadaceae bacterium]|nr:response regulator [Gemmatimonadaceae bacterium]